MVFISLALLSPQAPSQSWTKYEKTPLALAQELDRALHTLKPSKLDYEMECSTAQYRGLMHCHCEFVNPKRFHVEYPILTDSERTGFYRETLIAKGGKLAMRDQGSDPHVGPLPATRPLARNLLRDWFKNDTRAMFTAVGSRSNPFATLVNDANRPGSGYAAKAEQREVKFVDPTGKSHTVKTERIVITRDAVHTKREGDLMYEVIVDDRFHLPVSMTNTIRLGKQLFFTHFGKSGPSQWVLVHTGKGNNFDPAMFDFKTIH